MPALPVAQRIGQCLHRFPDDAVGLAFVHLKGANLVHKLIDDISKIERIEHAHAEVDGELQVPARRLRP